MAILLFLGVAACGYLWWSEVAGMEVRLRSLRERGLPTTAREVNDFYVIPSGVIDRTADWVALTQTIDAAHFAETQKHVPIIGSAVSCQDIPPPEQAWDQLEVAEAFLDEQKELINRIRQTTAIPGQVRFPVDFVRGVAGVDLKNSQSLRGVSRILVLDAHVAAHRGDRQRVLLDIHDVLTLSDLIQDEPTTISQMIRYALVASATSLIEKQGSSCQWSDAELSLLQERLGEMHFAADMQRALAAETALTISELETVPLVPFRFGNQSLLLDMMSESQAGLDQPWPEPLRRQARAISQMNQSIDQSLLSARFVMLKTLEPAVSASGYACGRGVARQRLATIALAVQRHHRLHAVWPQSLEQLDSQLLGDLTDATVDPFTGKPFVLHQNETGWLMYSVAQNEKDDGGDDQKDVRFQITFDRQ